MRILSTGISPTYVKKNNFVLCFGNKYIAIPLPIELRAFYGLGEILSTQMMGKGLNEEPVTEALYGFTDAMIPVEVGQTAFRKLADSDSYYMGGIMPDFMVPLYEAYVANEKLAWIQGLKRHTIQSLCTAIPKRFTPAPINGW